MERWSEAVFNLEYSVSQLGKKRSLKSLAPYPDG